MLNQQEIDVVVIGLNSEKTLESCLNSILKTDYPLNLIHIYYVDGGSSDKSVSIAASFENVTVISDNREYPTPGSQRNKGLQAGRSGLVQFLDSDTELNSKWFSKVTAKLSDESFAAVCGKRLEKYPEKSVYNWIGNLEWNPNFGEVSEFGGDVCIKRSVLEQSCGYNNDLIAGEDPELSHRIILLGKRIVRLDEEMTVHDLAMYTKKQYWKRAFRSGHAFAEINSMYKDFWADSLSRILLRGGGGVLLLLGFLVLLPFCAVLALLFGISGIILLFRPRLLKVNYFVESLNLSKNEAKLYALHVSLVVIPQFFGALRFYFGRLLNIPLRNNRVLKTTRS